MNPTETLSIAPSYIGHVRNGVVVLNAEATLSEGQAVRVEPLGSPTASENALDTERAGRVRRLQQLFEQWTTEDGQLSADEAGRLHVALEQGRGLEFRSPNLN